MKVWGVSVSYYTVKFEAYLRSSFKQRWNNWGQCKNYIWLMRVEVLGLR